MFRNNISTSEIAHILLLEYLYVCAPNECPRPGLCRHRTGHSLGGK